jgi:hypothetical protein
MAGVACSNPRINQLYGSLWWKLVYAAQPSYRARRENLPLTATLAERQAEHAAILSCMQRGILNDDGMRFAHPERAHIAPPRELPSWASQEMRQW